MQTDLLWRSLCICSMKMVSTEDCVFEEYNCSQRSLHGSHRYSCLRLHLWCTLCILYICRLTSVGCPFLSACLQGIFNLWPQRQTVGQDRILAEFLWNRLNYVRVQHRPVAPWGREQQRLPRDVRAGSGSRDPSCRPSQDPSRRPSQLQGQAGCQPWGWAWLTGR